MPVIVVDGPEKAGKSTLCSYMRAHYGIITRHWGPVSEYTDYLPALQRDVTGDALVLWDRSWAAESVYAQLLGRQRILRDDPWIGEWRLGRSAIHRLMLLGPDSTILEALRTPDDLPVLAAAEQTAFRQYAQAFGWEYIYNQHSDTSLHQISRIILNAYGRYGGQIPAYAGPVDAPVIFLGEARNLKSHDPTAWLPFTTHFTEMYGRLLGDLAFRIGWTNVEDCPPGLLITTKLIIACGTRAAHYARQLGGPGRVEYVPHPSWLYRWRKGEPLRGPVERQILNAVHRVFDDRAQAAS